MYSKVISATLEGVNARLVEVEADLSNGLPVFDMVGYLASEVKEARERVRTAIKNQGYSLPPKRITVNLSPANIRKSGSCYDLAVAMAVLTAGEFMPHFPEPVLFLGELGLDGSVRKVQGVLPMVLEAKEKGIRLCIIPASNLREGAIAEEILCIGVNNLKEVVALAYEWQREKKQFILKKMREREKQNEQKNTIDNKIGDYEKDSENDFSDIKGQHLAKRAIEIAVAGHHNLLLVGPPGSGKTALAKKIPSIMPPLTKEESMELTKIYSISGNLKEESLMTRRPFRAPHHTISASAMAGGGQNAMPGEISLADKGVLFLDEFPEYERYTLNFLRQPLEEGLIRIVRNRYNAVYPADFMLVAAMNPCPCGYFPDRNRCFCTDRQVRAYQSKISGPLLDRIDLMVRVNPVSYEVLKSNQTEESSSVIRERILKVRQIQQQRFETEECQFNSRIKGKQLERFCSLTEEGEKQLKNLFSKYEISIRGYERILKLARTIADLAEEDKIGEVHLAEAAAFRMGWEYGK